MEATTDYVIEHPAILSTPWFMIFVLSLYLFIIIRLGPEFMMYRKPYKLKKFIIVHNIVQVVSCVFVVHEILYITNNAIIEFWKCSVLDETEARMRRHYRLAYFVFFLKLSELSETVIFVLRNKRSQVTKLHVFHHIATVTLIYLLINHNKKNGCDALFPVFLNSIVHIIMYSYYLVAAVADKNIVRRLTPIKKSITILQMVQFVLILTHAIIVMIYCGVPKTTFYYFVIVVAVIFYGFYDFYKDSYNREQRRKSESDIAASIPIVSLFDGVVSK